MYLDLTTLGLSADAKTARLSCLGGSDANTIMSGDEERILALWQEKRGEREPEDLSDNLAVIMGSFTEPLNAAWFEKQMGLKVDRRGEVAQHAERAFMRCTLDGTAGGAVWEAKHCGAFVKPDEVQTRYLPQLTHNMLCTGLEVAYLSVFFGSNKWECFRVDLDPMFAADLMEAERRFWECVQSGEPPVAVKAAVPLPEKLREVDMTGSNAWASFASDWLANQKAAKTFDTAAKELKALVEADVGKAFGHGIQISRSKAGALTIKQEK